MQLYKRMHKHLPARRNGVPQKEMGAEEEGRDGFCVQEQWGQNGRGRIYTWNPMFTC